MKSDQEIFSRIAYLRTMVKIKPHDFFYKGELASLLWLTNQIKDSRAYREWKKRFANYCEHLQVVDEMTDDLTISTICVDCGEEIETRSVQGI